MVVSDEEGLGVVDSLNTYGMLSPIIDIWREQYLKTYAPWFTFCRDLNQLAMKVWVDNWRKGEGGSSNASIPVAARVFDRGGGGEVRRPRNPPDRRSGRRRRLVELPPVHG